MGRHVLNPFFDWICHYVLLIQSKWFRAVGSITQVKMLNVIRRQPSSTVEWLRCLPSEPNESHAFAFVLSGLQTGTVTKPLYDTTFQQSVGGVEWNHSCVETLHFVLFTHVLPNLLGRRYDRCSHWQAAGLQDSRTPGLDTWWRLALWGSYRPCKCLLVTSIAKASSCRSETSHC